MDFILNGVGHGPVANRLISSDFDLGMLRPYKSDDPNDPRSFMTVNQRQQDGTHKDAALVLNDGTAATLRIREWYQLDMAVVRAARPRLRAVNDLRGRGLEYTVPNGMARTVLQYQSMSIAGSADVSMDGLRKDKNDRPVFDIRNLPLPIIHADFSFPARELIVSRNMNTPLDTTMAENAGRRVAETAEQMLLGTLATYSYGGGTIYGYTNSPKRHTYSLADPTAGGWVPKDTIDDILAMKQVSMDDFKFGPWQLYTSHSWATILDGDYAPTYPGVTLRDRIRKIEGITDVTTLDFLTGYQMLLVQMDTETIREVIGMDVTTVQWPTEGGMELNFKVMCIMVPQVRYDYYSRIGLVHGSV